MNFVLRKIRLTDVYDVSIFSVKIDPNEDFLRSGQYPVLTVLSAGHALRVFINGQLAGRQQIDW